MGAIPDGVNTITLNSVQYGLDVPNIAKDTESFNIRLPQAQYPEEDKFRFWREWSLTSFHEGERLKKILGEDDLKAFRYYDAEGVDTSLLANWGEAKLLPALSRDLTVSSSSLPMTVTSDGTTLIVGLAASPFIKRWTNAGGWVNATSVATTGAVTDLITDGTTLYGIHGGQLITSTDSGDNWTELGSYTTAVGAAAVNGEVYVGKSDGVYNHTLSASVSSLGCSVIAGYRENVYFGKDCRLYRYDARGVYLVDQLPTGFNLTALIPYRQVLLLIGYYKARSGYRAAVYYIVQGSENHLYSLGEAQASSDYRIYAAWGGDDEIFFPNPDRGGVDRYSMEAGGLSCGPIWNAPGGIPFKSVATCEGYLFVGRYDNVAGTDGVYKSDITAPSGAGSFNTTGYLTTPDYDFGYGNETKIFRDIKIEHDALAASQSIAVAYSLDRGGAYTTAGTSETDNATSATYTLSNITGRTFRLKFTFTGGGANTPTLTRCVVRAAPVLDAKWMWYLRVLLNKEWGGTFANLATAKATGGQLTFVDDDGTSYSVVVDDVRLARLPDPDLNFGIARVVLREV